MYACILSICLESILFRGLELYCTVCARQRDFRHAAHSKHRQRMLAGNLTFEVSGVRGEDFCRILQNRSKGCIPVADDVEVFG